MTGDYLLELNEQQRKAVEYIDTPQLVIAGAGSGKTRVLTYKIVHLLSRGYQPWRILALTFTNKAAKEMKARIAALMGDDFTKRLWMGTFHSIFLRILRRHVERIGYKDGFTIYDASDSKNLVKSIIKDLSLDDKIYKASVVLSAISSAKNALISPFDYASNRELMEIDRRAKKPKIAEIYHLYCQRSRLANAMDFDDILFYTYILLKENSDIRNHYREFFQYVLVDEYQDTNYAQHKIILLLTEGLNNLSVVGDDAQSIYSFRGAKLSNILNMKLHYPNLATFKLERNYRSTQNIIRAANSLIEKNTKQIKKEVFSENELGAPVEILRSYSDYEEAYLIANKIASSKFSNHDSYADYAILYRTNAQSRILEESLRKRNIPYHIYGALSFYQRKEIKDIIAYLRLTVNPDDDEALKRIINFPSRGIGETTISKLRHAAIENNISMWSMLSHENITKLGVNSGTLKKLEAFRELISFFIFLNKTEDAYTVVKTIIEKTGILSSLVSDNTPESISKQENINELLNGVSQYITNRIEEGNSNLSVGDYLSDVSLASDLDEERDSQDSVTLMTVHAAKGLEFKNVLIVGVEEELFPSTLSTMSAEGIEEERRLLYVAITRAGKMCVLSYATSRYRNGQNVVCKPSRFIREIDGKGLQSNTKERFEIRDSFPNPLRNYLKTEMVARRKYGTPPLSVQNPTASRNSMPTNGNITGKADGVYTLHRLSELEIGTRIEHSRFGKGEVIGKEVVENNERIVVKFDQLDTKTLLLKFARFNIIS